MSDQRSAVSGWSVVVGVLLITAGLVAIMAPLFAGVAISMVFGWIILFAGIMHIVYAWSERGAVSISWQVLIGLIYIVAAFFIISRPLSALVTLTLVLGFYIAFEGIIELFAYFRMRKFRASIWFLADGVISLILAALIFFHFPSSSVWALGTIVGVSLLFSGWARLTFPMGGRALKTAAV
jgi:uncharacterized membrane protein HdeD (DUF308 family)